MDLSYSSLVVVLLLWTLALLRPVSGGSFVLTVTHDCDYEGDFNVSRINGICQGKENGDGPLWVGLHTDNPLTDLDDYFGDGVHDFYDINDKPLFQASWSFLKAGYVPSIDLPRTSQCSQQNRVVWTGGKGFGSDCGGWCKSGKQTTGRVGFPFVSPFPTSLFNSAANDCSTKAHLWCVSCHGHGKGDPHFVGFNGCRFDFGGEDRTPYAIFADVDIQINALLRSMEVKGAKGTWMTQVGFRTADGAFLFDPSTGLLNFADMAVTGSGDVLLFNSTKIEVEVGRDGALSGMSLVTPSLRMNVDVVRFGPDAAEDVYLNLNFVLFALPVRPHGILGQTALTMMDRVSGASKASSSSSLQDTSDCVALEGTEDDYVVADGVIGTQFAFQRFDGQLASEGVMDRSIHALFPAASEQQPFAEATWPM